MPEQAAPEVESTYRPIHPALRRKVKAKRLDAKQRRTTVRTAKLVNATGINDSTPRPPSLVQVPIEPGHNNRGILTDPSMPIRHYLDKGFTFPYETPKGILEALPKGCQRPTLYCAVKDCFDDAQAATDPSGSERCPMHEEMYQAGEIRYATSAKEWTP